MTEILPLEKISRETFDRLPKGTQIPSEDGKFIAIKMAWGVTKILSRKTNKEKRSLHVFYNISFLKRIFGISPNGYINMIEAGGLAGGHYHLKIAELMSVLHGQLEVILTDPTTKESLTLHMNGKPVIINDVKYHELYIIPPKISHAVKNSGKLLAILCVMTSGQHEDDDVYPCEF